MMYDMRKPQWPEWETTKIIGSGGFGTVYEIQRSVLNDVEKAALKVISIPQKPGDIEELENEGYDQESITSTFQSHLQSIIAEYTLMKKLNYCANIVHCEDVRWIQHDDGIGWDIFIKMELLKPLMKAFPSQVIPEEMVTKLAEDMCTALSVCQEKGIIHRDIKPQNIFLSEQGTFKLGDFGIAKAVEKTMGGTKIGTYRYMAPEVYNNQPYGHAADIYSLGLTLYWLLNEKRMPFLPLPPEKIYASIEDEAMQRRLCGEQLPPPAHGSERLKQIVLKACAYDPKDRYSSAAEMLNALHKPQEGPPPDVHTAITLKQKDIPQNREILVDKGNEKLKIVLPENLISGKEYKYEGLGSIGQYGEHSDLYLTVWIEKESPLNLKKWFAAIAIAIMVIASLFIASKVCIHDWQDASCSTPKTCIKCGKTQGDTLEHRWVPATCMRAKYCDVCGIENGNLAEHQWIPATDSSPKTCTICGLTEGSALALKVGDEFSLGLFPQSGITLEPDAPIQWTVLDVQDNQALVISKSCLLTLPFHDSDEDVTWENCHLRSYLNGSFYRNVFSDDQRNCIIAANIQTENSGSYGTFGGNDTVDYVFLLSTQEAEWYTSTGALAAYCEATEYAIRAGAGHKGKSIYWWTRTPGKYQNHFAVVDTRGGNVFPHGDRVGCEDNTVRPAMWIDISKYASLGQ